MKPLIVPRVITFFCALILCNLLQAQTFGTTASAVWLTTCTQDDYFNTTGSIGPAGNAFANTNFGSHTQGSGTLILRGGEVRTSKAPTLSNVCSVRMYYRVYLQTGTPGAFNTIVLPLVDNCNTSTGLFPSGGSCATGDQKWNIFLPDGTTNPYAPVDLTSYSAGNYILEIYYDVSGSSVSTTQCDETVVLNNGGSNYKAFFSIQSPTISSANPTSCNGAQGSITINGLTSGATYSISYSEDGNPIGPLNLVANGSGQVIISGLKAGNYSAFSLLINGCTTDLNTGIILSNPIITPKFNKILPICAGSTPPVLSGTSINGISGSWSPAVIDNQNSATYTFTPNNGFCGIPATLNVIVNPKVVPTFSFGTTLSICAGGVVPALPSTSSNGITGSWNPSVVDNQNSGSYTFTPTAGQCAQNATFTVTVAPNITPTFTFGTTLSICAGGSVPSLSTTSSNNITGTWNPSVVDNQNSGTYTFTPNAGQCATNANFSVNVQPNVTPVFSFGTTLTICAGGVVPSLPSTSNNGVTGSWSAAVVDNQNSAVYTFTPTAGLCSPPVNFSVTVTPNIAPSFSFGNSLTICAGGVVPTLPNSSNNGIAGTWNPSVVDNQNSGSYTFTPNAGQCATSATFTVTVNPNITPTFSFGSSLTICAGAVVPSLPTTSNNGINGTWTASAIDNQNSASYTFTPTAGQCATSAALTVTVNPNIAPTFSFGNSLTICAGSSVPNLPTTSSNGITGVWSPAKVDNQNSGSYTFTPTAGQCATNTTFSVTVNPVLTPAFSFGTSMTICAGGNVPALGNNSINGVSGTWSPSTIDNQNSGSYTFTPNAGQCATTTTLTVTVNSNVTPTFSFGSTLAICQGNNVPILPTTSSNAITGNWNPSVVDNQNSGTYTFTPTAGQCATSVTFTVNVTPNTVPTFSFGTSLTICVGGNVPVLPTTSTNGLTGSWSPSVVDNQASGSYTFSPDPVPGQCLTNTTFTVTVNQKLTPTFNFGTSLNICSGSTAPILPTTSTNGVTGTWSPATIDNQNSGSYTFTSDTGQCALPNATLSVTVIPTPTIGVKSDTTVNDGMILPANDFTGSPSGVSYNWVNSNSAIGLPASGTGSVPSFTAVNKTNNATKGIITITPMFSGCSGNPVNYQITVVPLYKDVFVPNVFTPNGDGKNDILYVYSNYINKLEMRIFNQWGQQIELINDVHKGWDGKYNGTPQPVGVYVYTLKAVMTDGRTIQLNGNITLIR